MIPVEGERSEPGRFCQPRLEDNELGVTITASMGWKAEPETVKVGREIELSLSNTS